MSLNLDKARWFLAEAPRHRAERLVEEYAREVGLVVDGDYLVRLVEVVLTDVQSMLRYALDEAEPAQLELRSLRKQLREMTHKHSELAVQLIAAYSRKKEPAA